MQHPRWSIILAAGQGRRLSAVTGGIPKQFWAPRGGRSLLEETLSRVAPLTPLDRTITVIDQSQRQHAQRLRRAGSLGRVTVQPMDRGTAAGVLLGISEVGSDPNAVVLLTPSDHGVADLPAFRASVLQGMSRVAAGQAGAVLFAARPTSPTGDFGWIMPAPGGIADGRLLRVGAFVEKPGPDVAERLFASGAAWNTMVMVARVGTLLDLYRTHLPGLAEVFRKAGGLPPARRGDFLAERYPMLESADFSRDLLTPARGLELHIWPESLGWTDLGTPERLMTWLTAERAAQPIQHTGTTLSTSLPATAVA